MASPWHKYDGINTMAQKGERALNDTAHPGFKAVAAKMGRESGMRNPGAVLAASTRDASKAAHRSNPRLGRVK